MSASGKPPLDGRSWTMHGEDVMTWNRSAYALLALAGMLLAAGPAAAQKKYAPGVTDREIKIGQTMPYSGPASAYGTIGRAEAAYFRMINEAGGVNGRTIELVSLDDGYSPPKTVEQTRRLVEQEQVALIFQSLGTPTSIVVRKYLNDRKVPQMFIAAGATFWGDPEHYPWTIGWQPAYQVEAAIYAKYILEHKPDAKIAVFYQNDDAGKDYAKGFKDGLGPEAVKRLIVAELTYETSDPTVDSQIVSLHASGADVLFEHVTPKFAAQAIRKIHDIGWKPMHFLANVSASVSSVLEPAGLEKSQGIISSAYLKDPTDPHWADDKGFKDWQAWMKRYYPEGNPVDSFNVYGYTVAATMVQVLKQCGDDLSRENIMRQAASLDLDLPMLLPGIRIRTSPTNFYPIKQMRLQRFEGREWKLFGDVIGG
jgi:ABC-type branched-subunit amino acid transport system substrate-binding protein